MLCPNCKSSKIEVTNDRIICNECFDEFVFKKGGDGKVTKKDKIKKMVAEGKSIDEIMEIMSPKDIHQRKYIRKMYRKFVKELKATSEYIEKQVTRPVEVTGEFKSQEKIIEAANALKSDFLQVYQLLKILQNTLDKLTEILARYIEKEAK